MTLPKSQFELPLAPQRRPVLLTTSAPMRRPPGGRVAGMDQMLSTREVEQITGRHRCTIWRWVCAGTFPEKRAGGRGWLRSDVERWLQAGREGWNPELPRGER